MWRYQWLPWQFTAQPTNIGAMRRVIHSLLAFTIAFAVVASGVTVGQCVTLRLASAAHNAASSSPIQHVGHDHNVMHAEHSPSSSPNPAAGDHGSANCCAMCTVATILTATPDAAVSFAISAHVAPAECEAWSGNTVAVDPGIPKRIV
jgi:hypothetical protein